MNNLIIGKRVTIGESITSVCAMLAFIYPDYAPAIIAAAAPVTFIIQVFVANRYGITK